MKLFIDTANLDEIKGAYELGVLDGVTTNPSSIRKAVNDMQAQGKQIDMHDYIKEILKTGKGAPVSLEVIGHTYEAMVEEGLRLYKTFNRVAHNVVVKIPVNPAFGEDDNSFDGIKAIKTLTSKGIPVNTTLIFTPEQALLAAKAGAKYVSPFAGRVDDFLRSGVGKDFDKTDYFPSHGVKNEQGILNDNGTVSGIHLIKQCVEIMKEYGFHTEVLAASLRNARQVREAALAGAHVATLPLYVIKELTEHYKTKEGMENFTNDIVHEYQGLLK